MSFFDVDGVQRSLLRGWTDAGDPDPFVVLAAGRSAFRVEDLVTLVDWSPTCAIVTERKANYAARVRRILPSG